MEDIRPSAPLIRDPADWAREAGWVSRIRAQRAAERLLGLADGLEGVFGDDDEDALAWVGELRDVAEYLTRKSR